MANVNQECLHGKMPGILATMLAEAPAVKLCLSIILMISAGLSLALDFVPPSSDWVCCRFGFCRTDQLHAAPSYKPAQPAPSDLKLALRLDSANPYRWAEYGIALDDQGDHPGAQPFFNRATELGPDTPPVLMVAANHYLIDNQPDRALELGRRVLFLTATSTNCFSRLTLNWVGRRRTCSARPSPPRVAPPPRG
jgi:hypothetical protein